MTIAPGSLFEPCHAAGLALANRIVLSPMTRSRADRYGVPPVYAADYYAARAAAQGGAGLLITEGTQPSFIGQGYVRTPGIHTSEQILAWRKITAAVHAERGRIFLQIMHAGRISSRFNRVVDDEPPVAPSAIRAEGEIHTDAAGMQPHDMPRALYLSEIPSVIEEHALAARNAILAGFDGVELHAMGAYLPVQFLSSSSNRRDDAYGGQPVRRVRFVVELLEAMAAAIGADKVGVRISPGFSFLGVADDNPELLYNTLVEAIAPLGLAHLHVLEMHRLAPPPGMADLGAGAPDLLPGLRKRFPGTVIAAGNFSAVDAAATLASGRADLVAFGRPFLGTPALARLLSQGGTPTDLDPAFYYSAGPEGYTRL